MFDNNNTTERMFVKITAPFKLQANQRKIFVDGTLVNVAVPSGRQNGEYLYSASITLLHEARAVYTSAPAWASVELGSGGWDV